MNEPHCSKYIIFNRYKYKDGDSASRYVHIDRYHHTKWYILYNVVRAIWIYIIWSKGIYNIYKHSCLAIGCDGGSVGVAVEDTVGVRVGV